MKSARTPFIFIITLSFLALAFIGSCQFLPKKQAYQNMMATAPPFQPRVPDPIPGVQQLTSIGENSSGRYSLDGKRIIFVSRNRLSHKHSQIYELNIATSAERRLSFNDGESLDPLYLPGESEFIFASSTDELKNEDLVITRLKRTYYPEGLRDKERSETKSVVTSLEAATEIYLQSMDGRKIERLTESPGDDAEIDIDPKNGSIIVFTSMRSRNIPGIYLMNINRRDIQRLSEHKMFERGARFSPDGNTLVWLRHNPDDASTKLMVLRGDFRKPRELFAQPGTHLHPSWHPNGKEIVFASNLGGAFFNLYSISIEGNCLKRLTDVSFDQTQPAISPDGQKLIFSGARNSQQQLYQMDLKTPEGCQKF